MTLSQILELVRQKLIPKGDVKERAVKSGLWVAIINVSDRGLQLIKIIVLARLLSPTEIGIIGIALLTVAVLEQFSRFGIDEAIIQQKENNVNEYLNTAWSIKITRGIFIVGVAYVSAPYVAIFFSEPRSMNLIRVIALSSLLTSLQNPGVVYFRKTLDFHKQFGYTLSGSLINTTVTIAAVFVFRSVWAFVLGRIAGNITMLILSYLIHQYRPWLEFNRERANELIEFGKWIFGSGILLFLINQGDDTFVGWFLSASALGFYQLAYRISNAPSTEITNIISRVAFPAYSQVQTDIRKLRMGYFRTVQLTTAISFPMAVGIIVTSPTFVLGFLGEQWLPMILLIQILAIEGAFRSLAASGGALFKAVGRPDYGTKLHILRLIAIVILIYPATDLWGVTGTAFVIVISGTLVNPLSLILAVREVEGSYLYLIRLVSYPAVGSALMGSIVFFVRTNVMFESSLLEFFFLVFIGVFTYTLIMIGIDRKFNVGFEKTFYIVVRNF